jgi:DNA-directed RNA polymerase III subunit RPC1
MCAHLSHQLELTLDDIKWAIVATRKLKIKQEVRSVFCIYCHKTYCRQSITVIPRRNRLRIYIDGTDKYYKLRGLKRVLSDVVVKVNPSVLPVINL